MQTNTLEAIDKSRGARLEARISAAQKTVLQQAAALSGRTLSDFVVASAQEAANRVIQQHESIRLSRAEQIAFVSALLKPPKPNARLREAAKAYRKQTMILLQGRMIWWRAPLLLLRLVLGTGAMERVAIMEI